MKKLGYTVVFDSSSFPWKQSTQVDQKAKVVVFFSAERHNLHLIRPWDLGISWLLSVKIFQTFMLGFNFSEGS